MSDEDEEIPRVALLQGLAFRNSLDRKCVSLCQVLSDAPEQELSESQQTCLSNCAINYFNQRDQMAVFT